MTTALTIILGAGCLVAIGVVVGREDERRRVDQAERFNQLLADKWAERDRQPRMTSPEVLEACAARLRERGLDVEVKGDAMIVTTEVRCCPKCWSLDGWLEPDGWHCSKCGEVDDAA